MQKRQEFSWLGVLFMAIAMGAVIFFRAFTTEAPDPCADLQPDPLNIRTPEGCEPVAIEPADPNDPLGIRG